MMLFASASALLFSMMSWLALLAGSEEPNLVRKLAVGLFLGLAGAAGIVSEVWRAL